jgi:hypothetical protein
MTYSVAEDYVVFQWMKWRDSDGFDGVCLGGEGSAVGMAQSPKQGLGSNVAD